MKKFLVLLTVVALVFSFVTVFADANEEIKVVVDGEAVTFDQGPVLVEDAPMVPLRAIFEKMGAFVNWDNDTETAVIISQDTVTMLQIGNNKIFKSGEAIEITKAPVLLNDRTLIPVEAVALIYSCDVQWDSEKMEVSITKKVEEKTE